MKSTAPPFPRIALASAIPGIRWPPVPPPARTVRIRSVVEPRRGGEAVRPPRPPRLSPSALGRDRVFLGVLLHGLDRRAVTGVGGLAHVEVVDDGDEDRLADLQFLGIEPFVGFREVDPPGAGAELFLGDRGEGLVFLDDVRLERRVLLDAPDFSSRALLLGLRSTAFAPFAATRHCRRRRPAAHYSWLSLPPSCAGRRRYSCAGRAPRGDGRIGDIGHPAPFEPPLPCRPVHCRSRRRG